MYPSIFKGLRLQKKKMISEIVQKNNKLGTFSQEALETQGTIFITHCILFLF